MRSRRAAHSRNRSAAPSSKRMLSRSSANSTGPTSAGSPSTQIVRSLASGESWIPVTRFQPTLRPSASVPTPALHFHAVWRGW